MGGGHFYRLLTLVSWAVVILFVFRFLLLGECAQFTSGAEARSGSCLLVKDVDGVLWLERCQEVGELRLVLICSEIISFRYWRL